MKRVERLKPGTIINYAKEKFVVLGERNGGVFCLLAQSKDDVEFYDGNEKPYNDYRKSKLRATVEGRFLTRLFENGASMDDLVPYDLDLSETDGSDGYGVLQNVLAAPLTLWDYGKYKGVIPNNEDGAWWLATPLWAPRSPATSNSYYVWNVYSGGDYNYNWFDDTYGVRPAIVLNSSLLVSYEGEEEEIDLEKVPNELFMEEVERRWKKGMFTVSFEGPFVTFKGE